MKSKSAVLITMLSAAALLSGAQAIAVPQAPGASSKQGLDSGAIKRNLQQQIRKNESAQAAQKQPTPAPGEDAPEAGHGAQQEESGSFIPKAPDPALNDPATQQLYFSAMREYYSYRISGFQHRQRVFAWQFVSSKLIFATVLILVFAGIYFAAIQFHKGLSGKGAAAAQATDIEASLKGIKVSSPVLGVIILVISFAFFYLYLVYVYPIHEVF
ncbi:MAG TPA: hypothetical protein VKV30_10075 [Candidatus Angelobacter sp.]|nr:hypothetical protein [Candidatus Angelobacter sp.]